MTRSPEGDAGAHDGGESFVALLQRRARSEPSRVFARFDGLALTFADLDRQSDALAAEIRRRGIARGERVAVMMRNALPVLALIIGLAKAGAVWVPVNPRQRGAGLRYLIENSAPSLVFADAGAVADLEAAGVEAGRIVAHEEGASALDAILSGPAEFNEASPSADDLFAVMYTSGTTGQPKGVRVSHAMLAVAADGAAIVSDAKPGDVLFVWEPLYHIGGAQLLVLPLIRDVTLAMVPRFSAGQFWDEVRRERATHIHYLGGILQILLKQPPQDHDREHPVRVAWGGGCPPETWEPFRRRFGVQIHECYGMTETSSIATCNIAGPVGSVGQPLPWFDLRIADAGGQPVGPGSRGGIELRAKRPGALFEGYFNNPQASAAAFRGAWFSTGDIGSLDAAGNLFFHGRASDSVRCKGENVSAWEVEHVAAQHPAVEDCAMIGVPNGLGDEDIKLFLKPKPGQTVDFAAFSAWLGGQLAPYQMPRYIAVIADFERTPSERIMKHRLPKSTTGCWDRADATPSQPSTASLPQ